MIADGRVYVQIYELIVICAALIYMFSRRRSCWRRDPNYYWAMVFWLSLSMIWLVALLVVKLTPDHLLPWLRYPVYGDIGAWLRAAGYTIILGLEHNKYAQR